MSKIIQWFASGGGIAKCGPYETQVEAYDAMRLAPNAKREYDGQIFVSGLIVWPEYVEYTLLGLACPNPRDIPESLLVVDTSNNRLFPSTRQPTHTLKVEKSTCPNSK